MSIPVVQSKLVEGWETVIGLEIHAQVASKSKLFSSAATKFGAEPNTHVSLVDAAMPGMLPVVNEECIRQAIRTGLGLNAKINLRSTFDRKNYFYPDLPQGYQISQYKSPIVGEGEVLIDSVDKSTARIGIERIHLEQDAGKLLHDQNPTMSLVDLNRSGVALMEIVSKPDLRSFDDAMNFVFKIRQILRYLGTCDGDMEKGSLRADVNVSVRKPGDTEFGTRCEIKNLNSINFIGQAIYHEARRQIDIREAGNEIEQETRLFDPIKGETRSMRSKEDAHDYRYFPDPDLLPLEFTQAYVDGLKASLPELPDQRRLRFMNEFKLSSHEASVLILEKERADYYEFMVRDGTDPKLAANWLLNEYLGRLNKWTPPVSFVGVVARPKGDSGLQGVTGSTGAGPTGPAGPTGSQTFWSMGPTGPAANGAIVRMVEAGTISGKIAKEVLDHIFEHPETEPVAYVEKQGMKQVTDLSAIEKVVDEIVAANPDKAAQARAKPAMIGWFVGQVMKSSGGKANPQSVNDLLKTKLGI